MLYLGKARSRKRMPRFILLRFQFNLSNLTVLRLPTGPDFVDQSNASNQRHTTLSTHSSYHSIDMRSRNSRTELPMLYELSESPLNAFGTLERALGILGGLHESREIVESIDSSPYSGALGERCLKVQSLAAILSRALCKSYTKGHGCRKGRLQRL